MTDDEESLFLDEMTDVALEMMLGMLGWDYPVLY